MMFDWFKSKKKEESAEEKELIEKEPVEEIEPEPMESEKTDQKQGIFQRLKSGLIKTKAGLVDQVDRLLKNYTVIDDELYEDLEEVLISADVGMECTMKIIDDLQETIRVNKIKDVDLVMPLLKEEIAKQLQHFDENDRQLYETSPTVILVVGVNGVGKTTTIGKLAYRFKQEGQSVLLAAGDTFRAAATEQLKEWSTRAGVDLISLHEGADPAAVIYDSIQAAKSRKTDVLICDTAGRLHNKSNLMNELNKIYRIVEREFPEANKETLLVLDATTGQNAIMQAKTFMEVAEVTGIALTKLDGSAKGGVIIALESELGIPVKLVGVGEKIDDLQPFNGEDFVEAIFN